ncbi:MAG: oligosaccharide flippase family protein, partial [Actinomycetota bacterium]
MAESTTHRPFRRRVLLNTAVTGVANVWAMVVALVTLPILLAGLGAEGFGLWVLLQTFSALNGWLSLGDIGLATATPRFLAGAGASEDERSQAALIGTSLVGFAALGTFWGALLAAVGPAVLPALFDVPDDLVDPFRTAVLLTALMAVLDQILRGGQACLEGLQRVDLSRWGDVVRRSCGLGAAAAAAAATGSLVATATAALAGSVVGLVFVAVALIRHLPPTRPRVEMATARRLFSYGRSVAVLRPIGVVHRMMDRVIVGIVLGPAFVGIVEIATQVQNGAQAVLSATSYSVIPGAAHLDERGDRATLRDLALNGTRLSLLATMPFVIIPAVLAAPL